MSHTSQPSLSSEYPLITEYIKTHGFQSLANLISENQTTFFKDLKKYFQHFEELRKLHLLMYNDAKDLYKLSLDLNNPPYLVRAFCKEVIAVIEADLYNLNNLHPYDNYKDKHCFICKTKKTLKFYAKEKTSNNSSLKNKVESYLGSKFKDLRNLNKRRNDYTHPKSLSSLQDIFQIEEALQVLEDYNTIYNKIFRSI